VRAKWPLHDLRNNPRDERAGACPAVEAAAVGSLGESSLPACRAARRGSTPPGPRPPCGQIGPCAICATTPDERPGGMPSGGGWIVGGTSVPASPCVPTRVNATRAEATVRANRPLRDLRNNPPGERPGACPADEAAAVGSPGGASLPASPCVPTRVNATRTEATVRANWPLRDLRNNSPGERPRACPADEAAAVGSPGDSSLPAVPRGPTLVSATRAEATVRANWPLRDLRNNPPGERPGACPVQQPAAAAGHDGGLGAARRLAPGLAEALRITTPAGTCQPSVRAELEALFAATARVGRTARAGRTAPPVTPVGATAVFGGDCVQRPFAEAGVARLTRRGLARCVGRWDGGRGVRVGWLRGWWTSGRAAGSG
jgi:hypothetical protein